MCRGVCVHACKKPRPTRWARPRRSKPKLAKSDGCKPHLQTVRSVALCPKLTRLWTGFVGSALSACNLTIISIGIISAMSRVLIRWRRASWLNISWYRFEGNSSAQHKGSSPAIVDDSNCSDFSFSPSSRCSDVRKSQLCKRKLRVSENMGRDEFILKN